MWVKTAVMVDRPPDSGIDDEPFAQCVGGDKSGETQRRQRGQKYGCLLHTF